MPRFLAALGEGAVHGLDDVAAHGEIAQPPLGFQRHHPLAGTAPAGQSHLLQMLEPADHQAADLRIVDAGGLWPQIDVAQLLGGEADLDVEAGPALGVDLTLQGLVDGLLGAGAEFDRHQILGERAQAVADVVPRDDQIGPAVVDAADQQMDMRVVGVPVIDGHPVEPGAEIGFHLAGEVAGERLDIGHLAGIEPQITAIYRRFGLNDRQIEIVARAMPKRDYYCQIARLPDCQSRRGNRLFELGLSEVALSLCAASSRQHQQLIALVHARSGTDGFLAAWLRENDLAWAADMIAGLTNVISQTRVPSTPSPEITL